MNLNKIEKWITVFFLSTSIFVAFLLLEAVILTLTHQFKPLYLYFSLILAFVVATLFSIPLKKDIKSLPKMSAPIIILIILVSLLLIFYPHDSFGGRDESIYSNLAAHLASNFSLEIQSYLNNLPGNFVENIRTWYQGYPIWLGTQVSLLGIQWMLRSNVIIIILGLSSFFLVSSYLGGRKIGLISTILFSSSMPFLWFSRETMSENLAFFLLWTIIVFLLFYLKTKQFVYLSVTFICSWVYGLTRFEGFLLQFVFLLTLFSLLILNKIPLKKILAIIGIGFLVLISNIYINKDIFIPTFLNDYVPQVTVGIIRNISSLIPKNFSIENIQNSVMDMGNQPKFNNLPLFIFLMMAKYNYILVIFSIFVITIQFLFRIKKLEKQKKFFFIILILLIPEYYKLISPSVTIDQPWLYRRYVYALLPLGYICLSLLLSQLNNKKLLIFIISGFLLINITLSNQILFLKNNWGLIDKLNEIVNDVSRNDLIIIEERPLGFYSPASYLILNKGIRSVVAPALWQQIFLPERKILNGLLYNKIFLLSAKNKDIYPPFKIVSRKSINVKYTQLVPSCQLYLLGITENLRDPYNVGLLPLLTVERYCSQPKNEIVKHNEKLYLYELVY